MEWLYGLILEIVEYVANGLLGVFSMDLEYFEKAVPVAGDIMNIILASAWALLLGNLVFQAAKSMMSGLGLEGEDPRELFTRTFLFAFLLIVSKQVCRIGLSISATVIDMLKVPSSVEVNLPPSDAFGIDSSWFLMIIVGVVLMWQLVKLFLEIGERYFLVGFLTLTAPWAFAMGGSKNTSDIFKGWVRMFASMCLMMVLSVVFLKIILSVMGNMPEDEGVIPWLIFVIAVCRVARKIDSVVLRIGLNPASTGDGLGRSFLGNIASYAVMRTVAASVTKAVGGTTSGKGKSPSGGTPPPPGASSGRNGFPGFTTPGRGGNPQVSNNYQSDTAQNNTDTASPTATSPGTAGTEPHVPHKDMTPPTYYGAAGRQPHGTGQNKNPAANVGRRTSVPGFGHGTHGDAYRPGIAGMAEYPANSGKDALIPLAPGSVGGMYKAPGTAGGPKSADNGMPRPTRYTSVPPGGKAGTYGTAGTAYSPNIRQGGVSMTASAKSEVSNSVSESVQASPGKASAPPHAGQAVTGTHGVAREKSGNPRDGRNGATPTAHPGAPSVRQTPPVRQEGGSGRLETPRISDKPASGTAGTRPRDTVTPKVTKPEERAKQNAANRNVGNIGIHGVAGRAADEPRDNRKTDRTPEKKAEGDTK